MRRTLLILLILVLAACTSTSAKKPNSSSGSGCGSTAIRSDAEPVWTRSAHPPHDTPWVLASGGNAVGVLFNYPLRAGQDNKILWIVKLPQDGNPLRITATPLGGGRSIDFPEFPDNSSPGAIYPSSDNVPTSGCWHLVLKWGPNQDSVDVPFV